MSSFLVMMPVLMLASVSVKFKGILKSGWQRFVSGRESVNQQSRHDGQHKKDKEQQSGLAWEQSQHHKRLIPGRCDHHRDQRSETQHPVRVERHGGETSDTTGYRTEQSGDEDLGET